VTRRVLVPLDGTPLSERALAFALDTFDDATVVGLHVRNPTDPDYGASVDLPAADRDRPTTTPDLMEQVTDRVVESAETVAADHDRGIEVVVKTGRPGREIVAHATDHDIDHVVLGSHGRTGMDRLLLGSVSETVVKRSPVSVTVVRDQ
jgi:nucleotide-binding universal stress UspA family protein